ncbi:hypothetical protein AAFF_G00434240 [Aldrovandia affinis]|uniref:Uncharacterized protein n=1 Tax=Aldrovandia affinis TaxID=143900 RepID=A0AAD7S853_9TELE|nr:hypothetical protein AAFF_G00434240 [Aldrovandia affinis]
MEHLCLEQEGEKEWTRRNVLRLLVRFSNNELVPESRLAAVRHGVQTDSQRCGNRSTLKGDKKDRDEGRDDGDDVGGDDSAGINDKKNNNEEEKKMRKTGEARCSHVGPRYAQL